MTHVKHISRHECVKWQMLMKILSPTLTSYCYDCCRAISLEDVKELEPMVGRSLEQLLQYEGDDLEDVFALTFEVSIINCHFSAILGMVGSSLEQLLQY